MARSTPLALALAPALLVGCEAVSSQDIRTGAIYADVVVESEGAGSADVHAVLRLGGATSNTFVDLEGGDRLTVATDAEGAAEPVDLVETNLGAIHAYSAEVPGDAAGTTFTVALERDLDESAPASTAVMPAPFALLGPAADATFSRSADDLVVTWEAGEDGDAVVVELEGDCLTLNHWRVPGDPGTFTIEAGEIEVWDDESGVSCAATVSVLRYRDGALDPALSQGGSIRAGQRRSVRVRLDP